MQDNFKCIEFNCIDAAIDNCTDGYCCYGDCGHCDNYYEIITCENCIYKGNKEEESNKGV